MGKYISCGQYNKNYKYIILGIFFNILANFIVGFDFKELLLFNSEKQKELYKHFTVHEIFQNIGVFLLSIVFYKIETMSNKKEINSQRILSYSSTKSNNQIILIFNDSEEEMGSISILSFIFLITIYVCIEFLAEIFFQLGLNIFDLWMFELLVISYINAKMFKLKIYRHQKFAIIFNSLICLLFRIPYFILSLKDTENNNKELESGKSLFEISGWYIVLGLFIYIIIITIRSYTYTKVKWFIDLKYISPTKLLIYIGFIGILVSSISCVIETNIKCTNEINFCEVKDKNNNTYIDNFNIYYEKVSEINDREEIIYETCIILFGMIFKFFALYFDMLIIKFLTPVHIILYGSLYYFIIKLIDIFYHKIKTSYFFKGSGEMDNIKFCMYILDFSGNFIAIFGFLIYLEIIELGFCKLNYNLRKYIEKRSINDINQSIDYDGFNEEDEQSEKNRNSKASELGSNPL